MNRLHKLKQEAEKIRLTSREKDMMRARIFETMDVSHRIAEVTHRTKSPYYWFTPRLAMPLAAFLVIVLGGGTAYAAQGSLPGSALYPVKIYVNEGVAEALAVSNEAKVSFHTSVAEERLKEAEALASEGKLDAATVAQIETSFDTHVAKAETIAAELEEKDPAAGVEATVRLDSSLAAHGGILANLGENSTDEVTKENSNRVALRISLRSSKNEPGGAVVALKAVAPAADATSLMTESANIATGTSVKSPLAQGEQKKIVMQIQKKATHELEDTRYTYNNSKHSLSATTTAKVKAQLSQLEKRIAQGKKEFKKEEYVAARATFTAVIQDSVELQATIEASKTFKRDFVRSWAGDNGEVQGWSDNDKNNNEGQREDGQKKEEEKKPEENKDKDTGSSSSTLPLRVDLGL